MSKIIHPSDPKGLLAVGDKERKPGKYSMVPTSPYEKMLVNQVRSSLNLPDHLHDDMINRQLKWCKDKHMSIEEAKAHLLKTYISDINGERSQEEIDIFNKVMEGYKSADQR